MNDTHKNTTDVVYKKLIPESPWWGCCLVRLGDTDLMNLGGTDKRDMPRILGFQFRKVGFHLS
jgi:hypothetical protein